MLLKKVFKLSMYSKLKIQDFKEAEAEVKKHLGMAYAECEKFSLNRPFKEVKDVLVKCYEELGLTPTISATPETKEPDFQESVRNVQLSLYAIEKNINIYIQIADRMHYDVSDEFNSFQDYYISQVERLMKHVDGYDIASESDSSHSSNEEAIVPVGKKRLPPPPEEIQDN